MKTKNKLQAFANYLASVRQVGHTEAVVHGARRMKPIVVTHSQEMAERMKLKLGKNAKTVTINNTESLIGRKEAIVFDNCALYVLFTEAVAEIEKKERIIRKIKLAVAEANDQ